MKQGTRTALTVTAALVIAIAAPLYVLFVYLATFVTSDRPLDAHCRRAELPVAPFEGRLAVVIVDGLGFEEAGALADLEWLRASGVTRPLAVPYPSYTTPALLSFMTGLDPRDSGVRLNADIADITRGLDNLAAVARDSGTPWAMFGGGWQPFGGIMFAPELYRGRIATSVAPFFNERRSISYFGAIDEAGHEYGRASRAYHDESLRAARYLARHWSALDPARDRLMVVSDHGHLLSGGHGGIEPEVRRAFFALAGHGVRRGVVLGERPLRDVASTLALVAGLPTPACNTGRPMLDALSASDDRRARLYAPPFQQVAGMLAPLASHPPTDPVLARLSEGDAAALPEADALLDRMRAEYDLTTDGARDNRRLLRLGVLMLLVLALWWRWWRRVPWAQVWAPAAVLAGYSVALWLRGYRLTFSKMPQQDDFLLDASIVGALALLVVSALFALRQVRGADAAMFLGVLPWLACAVYSGADAHAVAPPHAGLLVFLWGPAAVTCALTAIVLRVIDHWRERILGRESVAQASDA